MNTAPAQQPIQRRPLIASIVVVAVMLAVDIGLILLTRDLLSLEWSVTTAGIVSGVVLSLLGAITVNRLGVWRDLGLIGRPGSALTLLWFLPFAIYGLLPLTAAGDIAVSEGIAAATFGVLIAFWKMIMLGLLLYVWAPRGRLSAVALATIFWSGFHLVGGIVTGARVLPTLILALSYIFLAFAFGAVVMRTRLLWPLVGCYGLLLATASLASTGGSNLAGSVAEMLPAVTVSVLLALYGVAVWPRGKRTADEQVPTPKAESSR